jgi:Rieske Fe-S protein
MITPNNRIVTLCQWCKHMGSRYINNQGLLGIEEN